MSSFGTFGTRMKEVGTASDEGHDEQALSRDQGMMYLPALGVNDQFTSIKLSGWMRVKKWAAEEEEEEEEDEEEEEEEEEEEDEGEEEEEQEEQEE